MIPGAYMASGFYYDHNGAGGLINKKMIKGQNFFKTGRPKGENFVNFHGNQAVFENICMKM